MNEIVNTFLLAGDKFMPEIYLKQSRFTKNKEKIQKLKKTEHSQYIYQK